MGNHSIQPNFNSDDPGLKRLDFPSAEYVLDQMRAAPDGIVLAAVAFAAVKAIEQRDTVKLLLRAALAHLRELNTEVDRLREQLANARQRVRQPRKAA